MNFIKVFKVFSLYFNTVKDLKFIQIIYLIKYKFLGFSKIKYYKTNIERRVTHYNFFFLNNNNSNFDYKKRKFNSLNKIIFLKRNWKSRYNQDKLIIYNLHYFDFLKSYKHSEYKLNIIIDWINNNEEILAHDPYVTSIRIINWVKYLLYQKKNNVLVDKNLYSQGMHLINNLELHLNGNHYFTNGKALIFLGIYFNQLNNTFLIKGCNIIEYCVKNHFSKKGMHLERSPMYHAIVLEDLIDIFQVLNFSNINFKNKNNFLKFIKLKIYKIYYSYLLLLHPDNKISFFNDSTFGISSHYEYLKNYFEIIFKKKKILKFTSKKISFVNLDGFLIFYNESFYLIINACNDYLNFQKGHMHSSLFSFELSCNKKRVLVNSGISTYENNKLRNFQRSAIANNTFTLNNLNFTDVWKSFRVARSAKIIKSSIINKRNEFKVRLSHNGYKKYNILHLREFIIKKNCIKIIDTVSNKVSGQSYNSNYHLSPFLKLKNEKENIKLDKNINISTSGHKIFNSYWFDSFNSKLKNKSFILSMKKNEKINQINIEW